MALSKLHINLGQGLIEAEGEEAFVLKVYEDFKERLNDPSKGQDRARSPEDEENYNRQANQAPGNGSRGRKRAAVKRAATGAESHKATAGGITRYEPTRDPDLDLSELEEYVSQFELKSNPERYLVYALFLRDKLGKNPCHVDHLYSCFLEMKDDLPQKMGQNLVDTRLRNGFVKFTSEADITITTTGINYFNKKLSRKGAA